MTRSDYRTFFHLFKSIYLLRKYCKWGKNYDVTIFHEKNYRNLFKICLKILFNRLCFIEISLNTPDLFKEIKYLESTSKFGEGYRNMCRFFNSEFYIYLKDYDWYCRLDTDSYIIEKIEYNLFDFMSNHNMIYGYVAEVLESPDVVLGLGDFIKEYNLNNEIVPTNSNLIFDNGRYTLRMIYTNFEIINLSFFYQYRVQKFINHIDESGNIYKYRWGDAPLRTFTINNFLRKDQIIRFDDIGYMHKPYIQINKEIKSPYTPNDWIKNNKWIGKLKSEIVNES